VPKTRNPGEPERILERRALAWKLRRAGGTLYSIQESLAAQGHAVDLSTISRDLKHEMDEWRKLEGEEAQGWRDDTIAKLDDLIKTQLEMAANPRNIRAADSANAAVRAMERKAKLLGIDAPEGINAAVNSIAELIYSVHAAQD
jgi:hypothetical protein